MNTPANNQVIAAPEKQVAAPKNAGFAIPASTSAEAFEFCKTIANSDLVPKAMKGKPADIYTAAVMGNQLGLPFFAAIQNIACINGKPAIYGDAMLAVCQSHPDFADIEESCDGNEAVCTVTRKGRKPYTARFTVADAKVAGLWGKVGPWTQYPKRMLAMRARSFALRAVFADRLAGYHTVEEMQDAQVVDVRTDLPDPKPALLRGGDVGSPDDTAPPIHVDRGDDDNSEPLTIENIRNRIEEIIEFLGEERGEALAVAINKEFNVKAIKYLGAAQIPLYIDRLNEAFAEAKAQVVRQ